MVEAFVALCREQYSGTETSNVSRKMHEKVELRLANQDTWRTLRSDIKEILNCSRQRRLLACIE